MKIFEVKLKNSFWNTNCHAGKRISKVFRYTSESGSWLKSLQKSILPTSQTLYLLKTIEKLIHRFTKNNELRENPLHATIYHTEEKEIAISCFLVLKCISSRTVYYQRQPTWRSVSPHLVFNGSRWSSVKTQQAMICSSKIRKLHMLGI